jgi:hypothetical protein
MVKACGMNWNACDKPLFKRHDWQDVYRKEVPVACQSVKMNGCYSVRKLLTGLRKAVRSD